MSVNNSNFINDEGSSIKEHERLLPIANVGRIMKHTLPQDAKISKEAKETMQECVSEFISFVTGEASDKCRKERRKTVNGDDICWALATLGFDDYAGPMKRYLDRYREVEGNRSNNQERVNNVNGGGEEREDRPPLYRDHQNHDQDPSIAKFKASERNNGSSSRPFQD